jgi:hypothetical protein
MMYRIGEDSVQTIGLALTTFLYDLFNLHIEFHTLTHIENYDNCVCTSSMQMEHRLLYKPIKIAVHWLCSVASMTV